MQNSLFNQDQIPLKSQNENIVIRRGKEYCVKTGQRVLRSKKTKRPYILVDDKSDGLCPDDVGIIYMAFLRRIVQDASGDDLYDNTLDDEEKQKTRWYLTKGKITEYFYTVYEHNPEKSKRAYEKRSIKKIETLDPQYSEIQLKDICKYIDKDVNLMHDLIDEWQMSNWSRDHAFYKSIMDSTKMVASD